MEEPRPRAQRRIPLAERGSVRRLGSVQHRLNPIWVRLVHDKVDNDAVNSLVHVVWPQKAPYVAEVFSKRKPVLEVLLVAKEVLEGLLADVLLVVDWRPDEGNETAPKRVHRRLARLSVVFN